MTSTADTTQHPDVTEISDLTEGLLSEPRAAEVRNHIALCALCGDVLASLEEISELLGELPAPEPMPADFAERLDAALAAEALTRLTEAPQAADVSRETKHQPIAPVPSVRPEPTNRPAGHARAATGPGRRAGRHRRRTAVLVGAFGAAALAGMGVFLLQNTPVAQSSSDAPAFSRGAAAGSDPTTFTQSSLRDQVHALLESQDAPPSAQNTGGKEQAPSVGSKSSPRSEPPSQTAPSDSTASDSPLRAASVQVPECVAKGIGQDAPALAIEKGTYEGLDAFLVVLPHPTDPASVQAYVVDAACIGAEPSIKGKLLLTHPYSRP
ncbi:anti-sigma factor family protein [Streptomyces sp. NPDC088864]|uniref:anti-sigma factor family protein n=1 Tax=Streptomyces sp. NPDC088864 TaxID=3365910 RepID=UPI00380ED61B